MKYKKFFKKVLDVQEDINELANLREDTIPGQVSLILKESDKRVEDAIGFSDLVSLIVTLGMFIVGGVEILTGNISFGVMAILCAGFNLINTVRAIGYLGMFEIAKYQIGMNAVLSKLTLGAITYDYHKVMNLDKDESTGKIDSALKEATVILGKYIESETKTPGEES